MIPTRPTSPRYDALAELWSLPSAVYLGWVMASAQIWRSAMEPFARPAGDINIYLPFGNGFRMNIQPDTTWDIGSTPAPGLEKEILDDVGSYGRQIGRMMDVLADIAPQAPHANRAALKELLQLKQRIDALKLQHARATVEAGPLPGQDAPAKAEML